ncbi:MAG TPA: hypothetical protein VGN83_18370 [Falsiroseomonas sp.]|nr:hypothetical protein [Falsiroseomonas sp.]
MEQRGCSDGSEGQRDSATRRADPQCLLVRLRAADTASSGGRESEIRGTARPTPYKSNTVVAGRQSPNRRYSMRHVTFEEDQGAYGQSSAQGLIKLHALRLRLYARAGCRGKAP